MAKINHALYWLPAANTFTGFLFYSFVAYLVVLALGWCLNAKFDALTDYRRHRVEERERRAKVARDKAKQEKEDKAKRVHFE